MPLANQIVRERNADIDELEQRLDNTAEYGSETRTRLTSLMNTIANSESDLTRWRDGVEQRLMWRSCPSTSGRTRPTSRCRTSPASAASRRTNIATMETIHNRLESVHNRVAFMERGGSGASRSARFGLIMVTAGMPSTGSRNTPR